MVARSWDGLRTAAIAAELGCHPQTVRERLARFNAEGLDGLGDRPGAGRKRRLTEAERGRILALARTTPPGRLVPQREGLPVAEDEAERRALDARRAGRGGGRARRDRRAQPGAADLPCRRASAGAAPAAGRRVGTRTSPQKGRDRRPLHRPARRGDGRLRRRTRAGHARGPSRRRRAGRPTATASRSRSSTVAAPRKSGSTARCGCATGRRSP